MGFGLPVGAWIRGPLREMVEAAIAGAAADGYVAEAEARRLMAEHLDGRADNGLLLWSILALDLWSREVVRRPVTAERVAASSRH
jgi:asparagine synthase (glutamine-hydrolysing)